MMVEKRGLGRGLSALLGEVEETPVGPAYHVPLLAIDAQGSDGESAGPF